MTLDNRYLRPLPLTLGVVIVAAILLYIGNAIAGAQDSEAFGLAFQPAFGDGNILAGWGTWLIVAGIVVYALYLNAAEKPIWQVDTREVVYMALGAALYGLLSWAFNAVPVPAVGNVSLRPTIVIPIFFGFAFGPVVGFFTGFMGNVLGDALTGWGVFPVWDIANGLVGLISGLVFMFKDKSKSLNTLMWVGVGALAVATILAFTAPDDITDFGGTAVNTLWWVPVLGIALLLVINFVPRLWPILMGIVLLGLAWGAISSFINGAAGAGILLLVLTLIGAGMAYMLYSRRESIAEAMSDIDTKTIIVWGVLANVFGIGFAALADIWVSGLTPIAAFAGEFVPAAGPNILFAILLAPLLYGAWKQAQTQSGR
jgi:hypothetical protein